MKIITKKKKSLWKKIDDKLFDWGSYLMFNPTALIYTLYFGIAMFILIFSYLGYMFFMLARNGAVGYYFGFVVMIILNILLIIGIKKVSLFKKMLPSMNVSELNDMFYGDLVNPIIDKIKKK